MKLLRYTWYKRHFIQKRIIIDNRSTFTYHVGLKSKFIVKRMKTRLEIWPKKSEESFYLGTISCKLKGNIEKKFKIKIYCKHKSITKEKEYLCTSCCLFLTVFLFYLHLHFQSSVYNSNSGFLFPVDPNFWWGWGFNGRRLWRGHFINGVCGWRRPCPPSSHQRREEADADLSRNYLTMTSVVWCQSCPSSSKPRPHVK